MIEFKHFFDYNYVGPLGDGMFGFRYWAFIVIIIVISIALYQYCKRHPKYASGFAMILCSVLFLDRMIKQIYRVIAGIEDPALMALPWHLCTLMTFVMPIVLIFNIKKLKPWVYPLCMIGGIVTLFLGDFFYYKYLKYEDVEGMFAHVLLIFIPVIEMAIGNFKLVFKKAWQACLGLIVCTLWGLFADLVLFPKYHTNSSQLMENNLGFEVPGIPFQLIMVIISIIFITVMYAVPTIYRKIRNEDGMVVKRFEAQVNTGDGLKR